MIQDLLTQLGTTGVVVAVAGYFFRSWMSYEIQSLRSDYEQQHLIHLETIRAEFSKDIARLSIHENYLHRRRVELIEEIYHKAVDTEYSLQTFFLGWWAITDIDRIAQKDLDVPKDAESALDMMENHGMAFRETFLEINASLHKNALIFDDEFIRQVTDAYRPFFELILNFNYDDIPKLPEEYEDVASAGRIPRSSIVKIFRRSLGVVDDQ